MRKGRVLIADDESYVTAIVGRGLQQSGYEVVVASDGEEAYQIACSQHLNMIVTDFQMPVLDGLGLGRLLKSNPITAGIPVLMLTSRGHQLTPTELAQTSIKRVQDKPFSVRQLISRVEEMATSEEVDVSAVPSAKEDQAKAA
jgi:CheY-like chemotaxis protein